MITKKEVNELFEYKAGDLYWKTIPNNKVKSDRKAGLEKRAHSVVGIRNKKYPKSQLIFLMHYGYNPERIIFLDKNPHNYSIDNLKAATSSNVISYARKRKDNTSGFKGVSFCNAKNGWVAYISKNKRTKYLGLFKKKEDAAIAYKEAAVMLHKEFAYLG